MKETRPPIACSATDALEAAIVLKRLINIAYYNDEDQEVLLENVRATDLLTKDSIEWLELTQKDGHKTRVRTNDIIRFEAVENSGPTIQYHR